MKAYKITVKVETQWTLEVHAETEEDAKEQAERLTLHEIEAGGDLVGLESTEATDAEEMYPPEEEADEIGKAEPSDTSVEDIDGGILEGGPGDENTPVSEGGEYDRTT